MAYVEDRIVHDADSHLMELPDCLDAYFDPQDSRGYDALPKLQKHRRATQVGSTKARAQHEDPEFRAGETRTSCCARTTRRWAPSAARTGRRRSTCWASPASWCSPPSAWAISASTRAGPVDLCYAAAQAHNRMMTDFCSVDRRLLGHRLCAAGRFRARRRGARARRSSWAPRRC